jgi:hypothetical protein
MLYIGKLTLQPDHGHRPIERKGSKLNSEVLVISNRILDRWSTIMPAFEIFNFFTSTFKRTNILIKRSHDANLEIFKLSFQSSAGRITITMNKCSKKGRKIATK